MNLSKKDHEAVLEQIASKVSDRLFNDFRLPILEAIWDILAKHIFSEEVITFTNNSRRGRKRKSSESEKETSTESKSLFSEEGFAGLVKKLPEMQKISPTENTPTTPDSQNEVDIVTDTSPDTILGGVSLCLKYSKYFDYQLTSTV